MGNLIEAFLYIIVIAVVVVAELVSVIQIKKNNSFVSILQDSYKSSLVSCTILASEEYESGCILKVTLNNVYTVETYDIRRKCSIVPKAELYVSTSNKELGKRVGESGLFLLEEVPSSVNLPDYVGRVIGGEDAILWIDKSTGDVVYTFGSGMYILDDMLNNDTELSEYAVGLSIIDTWYDSYFDIAKPLYALLACILVFGMSKCIYLTYTALKQQYGCKVKGGI